MRIARICYAGYKSGSSKRSFEGEILKAALNGCDVGDLNHSDQFPRRFRSFVRREIRNRTKSFLSSKLEQTGVDVTASIEVEFGIKASQLEGACFDGAYFHQSVPKHLKEAMKISDQFVATHDPLHKTGIVDAQCTY